MNQFVNDPDTSMYICGSTAMGKDVTDVIERHMGLAAEEFKKVLVEWEKQGKLVKELW